MKAEFRTTRNHAFVVRQDDLSKIWRLLEDHVGHVKASGECSDDMVRQFDNWEQLASYDNPSMKKILKLSIQSRSDDREKSAHVDFSYNWWATIYIRIEAPEKDGTEVKDKIYDILDGIKPWYSVLAGVDFNYLLLFFWVMYLVWYIVFGPSLPVSSSRSAAFYVVFFLIVLTLGLAIHISTQRLNKLWSWLFPVGYFALGQGEQRYKTVEKVQWGIVVAFIVSLAASMVSFFW